MTGLGHTRGLPTFSRFAAMFVAGAVMTSAQASVEISSKPTHNMTCTGGVCTPTAKNAVLNAIDLANMLGSENTTVKSTSLAQDIEIDAALSWISASRLTLDSYRGITIDKFVSIKGSGALTLMTDDGGTGGDIDFEKAGRIAFWDMESSLTINGVPYTLEPTFTALAEAMTANLSGAFALANNDKARKRPYRTSPIDRTFNGTLEGLGNTISDLSLTPHKDTAGMITEIGTSGTVRDLSLANLSIEAYANRYGALRSIGGLAGITWGFVDGVHVSGTLNASNSNSAGFGLLAAGNGGNITKSSASGTITVEGANNSAGGLVGGTTDDPRFAITWSHASVDVTNTDYTGGLAATGGNIYDCYATGNVSGGLTGGLVGTFEGTIADSFATGNVTGGAAGGLFGSPGGQAIMRHVYATGSVTSSGFSGGLTATKVGDVDQAYAIGAVTTHGSDTPGGLIGEDNQGATTSSVWDLDTTGITNPAQGAGNIANDPGIIGLTDAQLKSGLPSGFDPAIWGQSASINNGYPYLLANPPPQ